MIHPPFYPISVVPSLSIHGNEYKYIECIRSVYVYGCTGYGGNLETETKRSRRTRQCDVGRTVFPAAHCLLGSRTVKKVREDARLEVLQKSSG